jgi:hypothetical protein
MTLSWCAFTYEILGNPTKACEMAKKAFDEAVAKLDELDGN